MRFSAVGLRLQASSVISLPKEPVRSPGIFWPALSFLKVQLEYQHNEHTRF